MSISTFDDTETLRDELRSAEERNAMLLRIIEDLVLLLRIEGISCERPFARSSIGSSHGSRA